MKKTKVIVIAGVVAAAGVTASFLATRGSADAPSYRFVPVERGTIDQVVSATGTLSAVTTVQVGTQVSGLIAELYADFNDRVEKGQVIARLDTTLLESNLRDVQAALERSQAELRQAERDLERLSSLYEQGVAAVADYHRAQYLHDVARAQVKSAEASLARARQNLAYATIVAPVSGIVVERAVDVGQTVAASLQAPRLFTIANDLSEMQILAAVDESDIGAIKEGQTARFTVKAYPERAFTGTVKQVRLQSTMEQNIVNYTVVVAVANPDGVLLPGMTATLEFVVAHAEDVLKIPNAALRFRPPDDLLAEARERFQKEMEARRAARDGSGEGGGRGEGNERGAFPGRFSAGGNSGRPGAGDAPGARPQPSMLFYLKDGALMMMPVRPGITDGQFTEVRGPFLAEGMQVIVGMTRAVQARSTNPFQPTQPAGPRPFGGF